MAYRLKRGEALSDGVRRVAREELSDAIAALRGRGRLDEAVHGARKNIKKVRALLRLARPETRGPYRTVSASLREAGRMLSPLRDVAALAGAAEELAKRQPGRIPKRSLAVVRRALRRHREHMEAESGGRQLRTAAARALSRVRRSGPEWSFRQSGFRAIEAGLEKSFREGKRALAAARKSGKFSDLHTWRKRVKDHWYHVRLLEGLWSDVIQGYEKTLKELEDALGEALNLGLLRACIQSNPGEYGTVRQRAAILRAIDEEEKHLRERAWEIGAMVYSEKPKLLVQRLRHLWKIWRA